MGMTTTGFGVAGAKACGATGCSFGFACIMGMTTAGFCDGAKTSGGPADCSKGPEELSLEPT